MSMFGAVGFSLTTKSRHLLLRSLQRKGCAARCISTTPFPEFDDLVDIKTHEDLHKFSLEQPDTFWSRLARSRLTWNKDFSTVSKCDFKTGQLEWFVEGTLNASVNCVDRHLKERGDQVALIWERDEPGTHVYLTYKELSEMVGRIGNLLRNSGVKAGDRVAIYLPKTPMAIATMLACARIGAIHSVVFAGFSADALAGRIQDAEAQTVVTANQTVRGGRIIELKQTVDAAVSKCPGVKQVLVYNRTETKVPMGKLDIDMVEAMAHESPDCPVEERNSEDTLFMLYTSGSTGKPKGITHSTAGYLLYTNVTFKHAFDYNPGEIFGCVADIGWITGHSYALYGPLSNGGTTLLFESTPLYPDPGRYWEMVERLKLDHIYLAPTSLRMLLKAGDEYVKKYDRSSLRKLGCVGEPLNSEAWEWYYNVVGEKRCDIIDTWWQTETGGICISPRPSEPGAEIRPGMPMRPMLGIDLALVDTQGAEVTGEDCEGALCIRRPWPGIARTIHGDHQRYFETYFKPMPGMYYTGDGAHRHKGGYYQITGRMDDVLNVSGHRLGTAEIEDVMDDHIDVAESAVVGFPHEIKGEGIYAYVVLKDTRTLGKKEIETQLRAGIKKRIGNLAQPDMILFTPGLPRTRSGKIMRRILRKVASDKPDELGDISTLSEPEVVDYIVKKHEQLRGDK
ncbi:acetyl-coenzyme A synthetase 2-like, mitochondrial [Aplysia californica]|uniref:Acetyl-coenzyme A synthetase n=1 Tax=Aplysia californica TaxID=6500 RepID=A0ABM0K7V8_APLCA|nr:acetyl-coenzyme A synthetase 2-like, mitochondrial [Aplysia californica]